jgi:hypothetical protein
LERRANFKCGGVVEIRLRQDASFGVPVIAGPLLLIGDGFVADGLVEDGVVDVVAAARREKAESNAEIPGHGNSGLRVAHRIDTESTGIVQA